MNIAGQLANFQTLPAGNPLLLPFDETLTSNIVLERLQVPNSWATWSGGKTTVKAATVVPAKAIERGQNGTYVYRIKPDNSVEVSSVTVGHVAEGIAIIANGLVSGDRIVVDGQYRLQPGARVEPRQATVSGS